MSIQIPDSQLINSGEPEGEGTGDFRGLAAMDLRELAMLQDRELTREMLQALNEVDFPRNMGLRIASPQGVEVFDLMGEAVSELADSDEPALDDLAADYASIYLNFGYQASPCESPWLDEDGLSYQEPMFQIRNIYRHYGLQADDWRRRSEDHIVLQMLFVAHLMEVEGDAALRDAANFLDEHPLRWVDRFAHRAAGRCVTKFYAALVTLGSMYLDHLRDRLAESIGEPRPNPEQIAERIAERNPKPEEDDSPACGPLCIPREEPKPGRRRYP